MQSCQDCQRPACQGGLLSNALLYLWETEIKHSAKRQAQTHSQAIPKSMPNKRQKTRDRPSGGQQNKMVASWLQGPWSWPSLKSIFGQSLEKSYYPCVGVANWEDSHHQLSSLTLPWQSLTNPVAYTGSIAFSWSWRLKVWSRGVSKAVVLPLKVEVRGSPWFSRLFMVARILGVPWIRATSFLSTVTFPLNLSSCASVYFA